MGSVWKAQHVELSTPAAVKLIDPLMADSDEALVRFKREAQAAATLRSPHVVQVLDYGVDQGTPFIAMELLDGESLAERLKRVGRLTPEMTATVMTHTARAVSKAHEIGVVHRDLKPDNIFIVCEDDRDICKVLDFGIAKQTAEGFGTTNTPQTQTGAMLGTPFYMSPEQASGKRQVDHRADIWAMAVIAYECLVGRRPFEEQTLGGLLLAICTEDSPVPSQHGPVPDGFDRWFARGVAKDPQLRFQSAREAALELSSLCTPGAAAGTLGSLTGAEASGGYPAHVAPANTTPTRNEDVPAVPLVGGGDGSEIPHSTAEQMPPSAVTVPGLKRRSGIKLALVSLAVVGVLGVGAGAYVLRGSGEPAPAAAPASAVPSVPEPAEVDVPMPELVSAKPRATPSAEVVPEDGGSGAAKPGDTKKTNVVPIAKKPVAAPAARPAARPAAAPAAAPKPAPAATPKRSRPSAKDRLDDGFGF